MKRTLFTTFSFALVLLSASHSFAQPLHQRIDKHIAAGMENYESNAAPIASDEEFLRRIYLDLTGRIPTTEQARTFLKDKSSDKREKLIDTLLGSMLYSRHMATVFDVMWIERRADKYVKDSEWLVYLQKSFENNKPYDQLVREVLAADGTDAKNRGPAKFYLDRLADKDVVTKDVSRLFLGMNLQCAQCHDHPMVNHYRQDFYYGIYAFYNRSYIFTDRKKKLTFLAEKAEGKVKFESVFVPKVSKETGPRLPNGELVKEPSFPKGQEYKVKPSKTVGGVPKFSRRAQISGMLASAENELFKRNAVNRLWHMMMGRGLVNPVDFDHPDNPPSHPELMELLAEEFAAMKFDIKAFLRELALSKTYQRSSQMPSGKELPPEDKFALAELRPLSPEQLGWSILEATGMIEYNRKNQKGKVTEARLYTLLSKSIRTFETTFGGQAGDPADLGFQATLDQTLFLRNGTVIRSWLAPRNSSLTYRLAQIKDDGQLAEELFLSVLSRMPTVEERQQVSDLLANNQQTRPQALQELSWALLASAEFRFNH